MIVNLAMIGIIFMFLTGLMGAIFYTSKDKRAFTQNAEPLFQALGVGAAVAWAAVGLFAIAGLFELVGWLIGRIH
jgi:hypothetical protein